MLKNHYLHDDAPRFPIVGIGASAGGLEAFKAFFTLCPHDIGMAFVLVPHLAPDHVSLLTEILQPLTKMPILVATDNLVVKPNTIYIVPPNYEMEIFAGKLQLKIPVKPHGHRMLIDDFFHSLAHDQKSNAIGIVFSGTGTDGTLGLRSIFTEGGITLVQDPLTAQFDGMPASAIKQGHVSQVLTIDQMPNVLLSRKLKKPASNKTISEKKSISDINQILMQIRKVTGNDFSLYKKNTISRRIQRRMIQHNILEIEVYTRWIKEHPEEAQLLFKELLINVTSFFRDNEAFELLKNEILPNLLKDKTDDYHFRVWVAGCSTGEEAYSIAILIYEQLAKTHQKIIIQIFSTDLDHEAIAFARAGIYSVEQCQNIAPERLQRFFTKVVNGFQINKNIREMVIFAVQNVVKDPPFTKLDLLTCRNLMIYLESELQSRLMNTFHYALKPNGVLFLSPSESIGSNFTLFKPIDRKWKFYVASNNVNSSKFMMSNLINLTPTKNERLQLKEIKNERATMSLAERSRRMLVQFFAPASVITDLDGNILYVHGETGKYLRPAPGQASLNVMDMAREGLDTELRTSLPVVVNENSPMLNREIKVKTNGDFTTVSLSVRYIPKKFEGNQNILLISFIDIADPTHKPKRKRVAKTVELGRVEELESDLISLKDNHQVIVEELQSSNEELKSTNEELQSTNEEMQSTNEELETSKEELQSVNEELITVNNELQNKIELLDTMQNDMKNLLDTTNIGIIFLDKHLNIRSFTREALRFYRLVASDVGRALNDIKLVNASMNDDLIFMARQVLDTLIPHESEIEIDHGTWVMLRIQPYRTLDNFIDGVLLTFTDITLRIQASKDALLLANSIVNTVREPLIVLDASLKIMAASRSFYKQFQLSSEKTIGVYLFELGDHQWNIPNLRVMLEEVISKNIDFDDYDVSHNFIHIGPCKLVLNARRIISEKNKPALILLAMEIAS